MRPLHDGPQQRVDLLGARAFRCEIPFRRAGPRDRRDRRRRADRRARVRGPQQCRTPEAQPDRDPQRQRDVDLEECRLDGALSLLCSGKARLSERKGQHRGGASPRAEGRRGDGVRRPPREKRHKKEYFQHDDLSGYGLWLLRAVRRARSEGADFRPDHGEIHRQVYL